MELRKKGVSKTARQFVIIVREEGVIGLKNIKQEKRNNIKK